MTTPRRCCNVGRGGDERVEAPRGVESCADGGDRHRGRAAVPANDRRPRHGAGREPPRAARPLGGLGGDRRATRSSTPDETGLPYPIHTVHLSEREVDNYYGGFANQVLWPLCHIFPTRCALRPAPTGAPTSASTSASPAPSASSRAPGDIVWVNDFHLCLVPGYLRAAGSPGTDRALLAHPVPAAGGLRHLPVARGAARSVCSAPTCSASRPTTTHATSPTCVRRFLDLPRARATRRVVRLPGRAVRVVGHGIGDRRGARSPRRRAIRAVCEHARRGCAPRLGADVVHDRRRPARLHQGHRRAAARVRALPRAPAALAAPGQPRADRRAVALPRAAVSRAEAPDRRDRRTHHRRASPTRHARPSPTTTRSSTTSSLAAWYRAADVALVTPLRDGMNLVAKEYVACHPDGDGVLVLSEFAGAARELHRGDPGEPLRAREHLPQHRDSRAARHRRARATACGRCIARSATQRHPLVDEHVPRHDRARGQPGRARRPVLTRCCASRRHHSSSGPA